MSHRDLEDLAGIAADPAVATPDDAAHLASCGACRAEVDAYRRVVTLARPAPDIVWTPPPPGVWSRIEEGVSGVAPVIPLDGARVRRALPGDTRAARPPKPWWWAVGAAAAGLAIGLGGGRLLWFEPTPQATLLARTSLETLDTGQPLGDADLVQRADAVSLAVGLRPVDAGEGYLEVWLINRDLKRMVSVGVIEPDVAGAEFPVSRSLLDQGYVIVDISREGFDDRPEHSGDSVVRGKLPL